MGLSGFFQDFNPFQPGPGAAGTQRALWSTLAHYDTKMVLQPELAEKWDFAADGKSVTFKLRQGVKFHSGREFTSDDVKASAQFAVSVEGAAYLRVMFESIKQVETPDKYTAVLRFDSPNPAVYDIVDTLYIIDKETIENRGSRAVGTGPFTLAAFVPNDRVEMVPFKDYWEKGKPYVDKCVLRPVPDSAGRAITLEAGAVDCIFQPSFVDVPRLKAAGGKYVLDPGASGSIITNFGLNCKLDPFTNKKVRQAMAWSIDGARFCRSILQGLVEPSHMIWSRSSWAYFKDLEGRLGYDLDKARALLKDAGMERGFDTEILCASANIYGHGALAEMLQADLRQIGVNAKVLDVETVVREARQAKGDIVTIVHAYGRANRDPGTTLTAAKAWFTEAEKGWTHFESPEYERLRQECQSTIDREKRTAILRRIQELVLDECFTIPIAESPQFWGNGSYVKDFSCTLDNAVYVGNVWLDK